MSDDFKSSTLYHSPSFIRGLARLVDFAGELDYYTTSKNPDQQAVERDWQAVGKDLDHALKQYGTELRTKEAR